jgi:hypothetical protein
MKIHLIKLVLLFVMTLTARADILPFRLPISIGSSDRMVLIDRNENTILLSEDVKVIHSFEKVDGTWIASVEKENGKWGYINHKGEWVHKAILDEARSFSDDNIARFKLDNKWGFIRGDGTFLIEPEFSEVLPMVNGLAAVQDTENSEFYYINTIGRRAFENSFSEAGMFSEQGLAPAAKSEMIPVFDVALSDTKKHYEKGKTLWGYINRKGEFEIEPQFIRANPFNEFDVARIRGADDNYRLINTNGEFVSKYKYEYLWEFSESGVAWAEREGHGDEFKGYIDAQGNELWPASYHDYYKEKNGLLVKHRGGYRVYDPFGRVVIDEPSKWVGGFKEYDVTVALRGSKWGLLYRSGKFEQFGDQIIAPLTNANNYIIGFIDGLVPMVNSDREIVYFNARGEIKYSFKPGVDERMVLVDESDNLLWKSEYKKQKIFAFAAKGVEEHFVNAGDYGDSIIKVVESLMGQSPRRYYVPNYIYSDINSDPYILTGEIDVIKKGAIEILAKSYISEEVWGEYYFLSAEYDDFKRYLKYLSALISKHYGDPVEESSGYAHWKVNGKVLQLNHLSDTGDGDFYNLLTLEVTTEDEQ